MNYYQHIINTVSETTQISDISKKSRERKYVMARQFCYACVQFLVKEYQVSITYLAMSRALKQDHTTGLHSLKSHKNDYQTDSIYRDMFDVIINNILDTIDVNNEDITNKHIIISYKNKFELKTKLENKLKELA